MVTPNGLYTRFMNGQAEEKGGPWAAVAEKREAYQAQCGVVVSAHSRTTDTAVTWPVEISNLLGVAPLLPRLSRSPAT